MCSSPRIGILCALVLGWLAAAVPSSAGEGARATALTAIDAALSRGEISAADAILYKVYFVKGSERLPKSFALSGGDREKCGTAILLEAQEALPTLPEAYQRELKNLLVRPTSQTYIDTEHFRIHYDTSGPAMIYGWPNTAYRDAVMTACEYCWDFNHVTHLWQIPPSDGTSGGGSGLVDCYVTDVGSGRYGYTQWEEAGPNWPNDKTAFFVIDHAYDGFGYSDRTLPMRVTVAHEYQHVVQFGYNAGAENNWWMEQSSTFMEDECYDSINDNYAYLSFYFSTPYKKLATFNGAREYGTFIWPTKIKELHDHDVVRQIWHCMATTTNYTCFDNVFGALFGTTFDSECAEWGVWNYYTSTRNDGDHYVEASAYPLLVVDRTFSTFPVYDQHPTSVPDRRPEASGQSVMRITRNFGSSDHVLTVTMRGPACLGQVCVVVKRAGQNVFTEHFMTLNAAGDGVLDIQNWNLADYATMLTYMKRTCGSGVYDYSFDLETSGATAVEHPPLYTRTLDLDQNRPNPFDAETRITYRLGEGSPVQLSVFDATGRQVRALIRASQPAGEYAVRWDGRDDSGRPVSPGVYFYRLAAGGRAEVRKMIVRQ